MNRGWQKVNPSIHKRGMIGASSGPLKDLSNAASMLGGPFSKFSVHCYHQQLSLPFVTGYHSYHFATQSGSSYIVI